ncbi:MAG: protein disulfide isomerase family protein [Candidatus Peregrinibacteria bacterium]|nr:protein disulfide isomerase family protein [Candidatus Peregrinibacteria bacterium]
MNKDQKRLERMEHRKAERNAEQSSVSSRKFWKRIGGIGAGMVFALAIIIGFNTGWIQANLLGGDAYAHEYAEFAQCLTDEGLVMYGTDWCPYCQEQKGMFEEAFEFIEYVNCDFNQSTCTSKGITGYPAWFLNDRRWGDGVQNFYDFAEATGCELPEGL